MALAESSLFTLKTRSDNAIVFSGKITGTSTILGQQIDAGTGAFKGFVAAMKEDGQPLWLEEQSYAPYDLEFDPDDNLFVLGSDRSWNGPIPELSFGDYSISKYDSDFQLLWHLDQNQLQGMFDITEGRLLRLYDTMANEDGSLSILGESRVDLDYLPQGDIYFQRLRVAGDNLTYFVDALTTDQVTIVFHSNLEVKFLLTRSSADGGFPENINFVPVGETSFTVETIDLNFAQAIQSVDSNGRSHNYPGLVETFEVYPVSGPGSGGYSSHSIIRQRADWILANVSPQGVLNWKKVVSNQLEQMSFLAKAPTLVEDSHEGNSIYAGYDVYQFQTGGVQLANGQSIGPVEEADIDTFERILIRTDSDGDIISLDSVLDKTQELREQRPSTFSMRDSTRFPGINGGSAFSDETFLLLMDESLNIQSYHPFFAREILQAAWPDVDLSPEGLAAAAQAYDPSLPYSLQLGTNIYNGMSADLEILAVVPGVSEYLVALTPHVSGNHHVGLDQDTKVLVPEPFLPQFADYQILARVALDGSILDVVRLRRFSESQLFQDQEFLYTVNSDGNYIYIQGNPETEEDAIDFGEYTVESLGDFMRKIARNKGPFTGLTSVSNFYRYHWKFGWVYETGYSNWWYSFDLKKYIYVPPFSSDFDFLFYVNDKDWLWTNHAIYNYVFSFARSEWSVTENVNLPNR